MATTKSTQQHTGRTTAKAERGVPGAVTSANAWKKQTVEGTPLRVPSGNTCLVRAPGMGVFMREGVIPNGLMGIIQEAMANGRAPDEADLAGMVDDPSKLQQLVELADAVALYCVIEPPLSQAPVDEEGHIVPFGHALRDPNTLYVDEVDFNDKMYIFNFAVGGTADFAKFPA